MAKATTQNKASKSETKSEPVVESKPVETKKGGSKKATKEVVPEPVIVVQPEPVIIPVVTKKETVLEEIPRMDSLEDPIIVPLKLEKKSRRVLKKK